MVPVRNYNQKPLNLKHVSEVLKVSIFIFLMVYVLYVYCENEKSISKTKAVLNEINIGAPSKSIIKKVKTKYAVSQAIPAHYRELSTLSNEFLDSLKNDQIVKWENIVYVGDIYARGVFPFLLPNDKAALLCYQTGSKCPDLKVAADSIAKYVDTKKNPVLNLDRQGSPMDTSYATTVCTTAENVIKSLPDSAFRKRRLKPVAKPPPNPRNVLEMFNVQTSVRTTTTATTTPDIHAPVVIRNDRDRIGGGKQNTHDHGVNAATRANLKRLKAEFEHSGSTLLSNEEVISMMVSKFHELHGKSKTDDLIVFSYDDLTNAHEAIVSLTNDIYGDTGVTQIGVLKLVVWKISTLDPMLQENAYETLSKRLATCFERGALVCATGKISRTLSVFEGVLENSQKSVSIDIVEKEIAQLASKVRDDYLASSGPLAKEAYESGNEVPEYSAKMASILKDAVKQLYVEELGMSKTVIDPIVELYADSY